MIEERVIKDYPNYKITSDGRVFNIKRGNEIHPYKDEYGYLTVSLRKDTKQRIHQLLFETFYRKIQPNEVVHHLSEIKDDNRLENLVAWDRGRHMKEHHAGKPGKNKGIKFTDEHKRKIAESKLGKKRPAEVIAKIIETKKRNGTLVKRKDPVTGRFIK